MNRRPTMTRLFLALTAVISATSIAGAGARSDAEARAGVNPATVPMANSRGTTATSVVFTKNTVVIGKQLIASSLKSVSANGAKFTFSSDTGPLAKLKVGSVMLLSGIAVRDVSALRKQGAGLVVTTTPASLTDLVYQGRLAWNTPTNFASAIVTSGSGATATEQVLGATASLKLSGKFEGYSYSMTFTPSGRNVALKIQLTREEPVDLSASVTGTLKNFTNKGSIDVSDGSVTSGSSEATGLSGSMTLGYDVKAANGLGTGGNYLLTLPGSMRIPVVIDGIPFYVGIKVAYFVGVGFSQKNQSVSGSYTIDYNGSSGFSLSSKGATTPLGAITELGKILLSNANAVLNGPISLVMGAQIPRLEFGLGVKGASVGAYVNLVASTAVQVGGSGGTGGCDARELEVEATTGAEVSLFGLKVGTNPFTLFDKKYNAAYPKGCGVVGG